MPRSKKAPADESPLSSDGSPFPKISKTDAVKAALEAGIDKPKDGIAYILKTFGVTMTTAHFSQMKTKARKPTGVAPSSNGKAHAPQTNGYVGVASSVEAIKGLCATLGVDEVVQIAELFRR